MIDIAAAPAGNSMCQPQHGYESVSIGWREIQETSIGTPRGDGVTHNSFEELVAENIGTSPLDLPARRLGDIRRGQPVQESVERARVNKAHSRELAGESRKSISFKLNSPCAFGVA